MQSKVGTDKNKSQSGESLQQLIERILRDLQRLDGSLTVFSQSEHPLRGEALRWHVPVLKARLAGLRSLRGDERGPPEELVVHLIEHGLNRFRHQAKLMSVRGD